MLRALGRSGRPHHSSNRHRTTTGQAAGRAARSLLLTLGGLRRAARSVAVAVSLLPFFLNTAAACGAFPEFDCCPDRANHVSYESTPAAPNPTAAHVHPGTEPLHSDAELIEADSDNCGAGDCEYCKGFFLAHLSALPAAITVSDSPQRSVTQFEPRQLPLEFMDTPPVPPPQPHQV